MAAFPWSGKRKTATDCDLQWKPERLEISCAKFCNILKIKKVKIMLTQQQKICPNSIAHSYLILWEIIGGKKKREERRGKKE